VAATTSPSRLTAVAAGADRVVLVPNPAGQRTFERMLEQIHSAALLLR